MGVKVYSSFLLQKTLNLLRFYLYNYRTIFIRLPYLRLLNESTQIRRIFSTFCLKNLLFFQEVSIFPYITPKRYMRILLLFVVAFALFVSCAKRIDKTRDPIDKTMYILEAIQDKKVRWVQNEYLGIENHPGKRTVIANIAAAIAEEISLSGLPDENQVSVHSRGKFPVAKAYCAEFNGNIVQVVSTTTHLGEMPGLMVEMQFAMINNEARLLQLSISRP